MAGGKKGRKGAGYTEVVPASIQVPMVPIFDESSASARTVKGLKATGFRSVPTNLIGAEAARAEISEEFRQRFLSGETHALDELLAMTPEFHREGWVQEALIERAHSGKGRKKAGGRPRGRTAGSVQIGLTLVHLIDHLAEKNGWARDTAFRDLAERGFENLDYDRIKQLYYQTREDSRLKTLIIPNLALRRIEKSE